MLNPKAMETTDTAFIPKKRIGRYEIVGELGRGAMGVVHKGYDPNIGRTVAIKTVLTSAVNDDLVKRFRREAQAAGVLSHPNIVTIYDAGEDQGVFYIAMEFVEGETLEKLIAAGPMELDKVTAIIEDVGSALDHAHLKEIIHRDIKPANIMITKGRAKVMDFGVAKLISSTATATGMVIGTPSYMSPEGVKGLPVDGRADIFSLGIVLYEMITATRPFPGDSIPSVIYKIIGENPATPTSVNPKLHSGVDIVLAKALAKDPKNRYSHCSELVHDLKNYQTLTAPAMTSATAGATAGTPEIARTLAPPLVSGTVAMPPATMAASPDTVAIPRAAAASTSQAPAGAKKSNAGAFAVIGLVVAIAAGAGWWWKHSQDEATLAKQQQEIAARQKADAAAAAAAANSPKPSPTGDAAPPDSRPLEPAAPPAAVAESAAAPPAAKPKAKPAEGPAKSGEKPAEKAPEKSAAPIPTVDGRLRIITFPPNAEVSVDDGQASYHTPVNIMLPAGKHKITLKHKRTSDFSREMIVVGNEIVELSVNLFNPDRPIPKDAPQPKRRLFP